MSTFADHPHTDPGDGRTECDVCGKWVFECIHSCKGVPVTNAAWKRYRERHGIGITCAGCDSTAGLCTCCDTCGSPWCDWLGEHPVVTPR